MKELSKLDARIPKWDLDNLVVRPCPICTHNMGKPLFLRPDRLKVMQCINCGIYFVSPSPSLDNLNTFYSTYHSTYSRMPKYSPQLLKQTYDKFEPLGDIRVKKLYSLMKINDAKILDLGFGQPFLLYLLKQLGAQTYGIDIDPKAIEYATYMKIHSVHEGNILDYNPDVQFDAILMTDFVEHPLAPMEFIVRAVSLLRKGGFVLIWTPNGNGTIEEDEPTTFRIDLEHMQYFTTLTIIYIARKLNLEIVHLETLGQPYLEGVDKEPQEENPVTKPAFFTIMKSSIKKFIRKNILNEGSEKLTLPISIGNYHLYTVLKKP
jgi:2-polyprenyl-3-methyl-5-hydroxy-6-metoxy-1,4-benzoquinol methylase